MFPAAIVAAALAALWAGHPSAIRQAAEIVAGLAALCALARRARQAKSAPDGLSPLAWGAITAALALDVLAVACGQTPVGRDLLLLGGLVGFSAAAARVDALEGDKPSALLLRLDWLLTAAALAPMMLLLQGSVPPLLVSAAFLAVSGATCWTLAMIRRPQSARELRGAIEWLAAACLMFGISGLTAFTGVDQALQTAPRFLGWLALAAATHSTAQRPVRFVGTERALAPALALGSAVFCSAYLLWASPVNSLFAFPAATGAALSATMVPALLLLRHRLIENAHALLTQRLQLQAARQDCLVDSIMDGVIALDLKDEVVLANRSFRAMFSLGNDDLAGRRLVDFIHPQDRELVQRQARLAISRSGDAGSAEYRAIRPDGSSFPLECSISVVTAGGIRFGTQALIRDISHQRLIERSQRAMAQRLEFLFSKMPLGCIIWDLDSGVQEWNAAAETIFGWSHPEALAKSYRDLLADCEDDRVEQAWRALLSGKAANHQQVSNRTKSGQTIDCDWFHTSLLDESDEVIGIASMVQDVTLRRRLERQLVESQKMEAVGALAGGIAHDFNNLLTTILGNVTLARMRLGPGHPAEPGLAAVEMAADRAAELTQQLLRFSRKTPAKVRPVQLNGRVQEIIDLLSHSLDSSVELASRLEPQLWVVEADPGQIGQVVMNLCVNARDAVGGSGRIVVETRNRTLARDFAGSRAWAEPGDWVEIVVRDNGCGMDVPTKARIFEPFFTTKPVGKGSGLGLATAYGIVSSHGGAIEVQSKPGRGAEFSVFLRRSSRAIDPLQPPNPAALRVGRETLLVADDHADVLHLTKVILKLQGYQVIEAVDGVDAVEKFQARVDEIDLVLLDLTMPRKSGLQALQEIHQQRPDLPALLMSGYSQERTSALEQEFLAKPFTAQQLLEKVASVLQARLVVAEL